MNHIKTLCFAGLFVTSCLSSSLAGTTGNYPGYSGQKKMAIIMLNWSDTSCPGTRQQMVDRMWNNSNSVRKYYRDMSRNVLDFIPPAGSAPDGTVPAATTAVYGPYTLSLAAGFHQDVTYANADDLYGGHKVPDVQSVARTLAAADGYSAANYDYIIYVTPRNDATGNLLGYAGYNSNYCHLFDVKQIVLNHEIGHNLHLSHSNVTIDVDGYNSQDCVMGNQANAHLDGPHSYQLGWYPDVCFPVKTYGQYDIENLAQPDTDNVKVLRFDRGAHGATTNPTYDLWIEYRLRYIGQDVGLNANWDRKVNIHYCEPRSRRPGDGYVYNNLFNNNVSKFAVGGSYAEPNNRCRVQFIRENSSNGSATVQLINPGGNQPPGIPAQSFVVVAGTSNFTVQANDPENNPLTYTILSGPPVGTLTSNGSAFTYTGSATGSYSFNIRVNDGQYDSFDTTISLIVVDLMPPDDATAPATPAFAAPPTATSSTGITMTAGTVTDPSGVQYYFAETSGNPGGSDSGWQDSPTYTDTGLNPSTTYSYTVKARDKSAAFNASAPSAALDATTQVSANADPVIYEPFAQTGGDAALTGQAASGIGLTGLWATIGEGSMKVADGSLSYGGLATSGNSLRNSGRRQGNFAGINSALSNAGLLADGGVLWFSLLHKLGSANNTNANFGFALGTDAIRYVNDSQGIPFNGSGAGVGFRIANTDQLTAAIWTPGTAPNINAGLAVDLAPGGTEFGSTVLIVGKITWGVNGSALDKVDLYLPNTSLTEGPVKSSVSVTINQSTLDNITFCGSLTAPADYYNIDEIRFGARYSDVTPVPVVEVPTIISHVPADGAGNVSPAADLVATFSEPIVLTELGTVTLVDTDNGSDTRTINLPDPGVSASGTLLTINPATNLAFGKNYAVRISDDAIEDVDSGAFAGISNTTTWNFQVIAAATPPYDNWATGTESFGGDANGDGVTDGMAWILGAASPSANAHGKLPVPAKDGAFLTLNFKRVNAYSPAKLYVEYGNNLGGWIGYEIPASSNPNIGGGIEVVVANDLPDPDQVTVKLPTSLQSPAGTLFVRLRATSN